MTSHTMPQDALEAPLPEDLARQLQAHGVSARDAPTSAEQSPPDSPTAP